jgi:hypothetical protein
LKRAYQPSCDKNTVLSPYVHESEKIVKTTEYVRLGYNQAMRQNREYLGFLMILMQRLVTSSTAAIATALDRRLDALQATDIASPDEDPSDNLRDDIGKSKTARKNWTNCCPFGWRENQRQENNPYRFRWLRSPVALLHPRQSYQRANSPTQTTLEAEHSPRPNDCESTQLKQLA